MTDVADLLQPDRGQPASALQLVDKKSFDSWLKSQPERARQAARAQGFKGEGFQLAILPGERDDWSAALGVANVEELSPWCLARAAESLPEGSYRVAGRGPGPAILGWLLGQYRFDAYREPKKDRKGPRVLLTDEPARIEEIVLLAESTFLVRDLVNIPAGDLGPAELQAAVEQVARPAGAKTRSTAGQALDKGFPMVAAVGRAASPDRAPRLIELEWGDQRHPRIAVIGKGVCFDSGGLDIKPASGMRLMKKDMGGAGHALALARLVMKSNLPVRLHLVIPAVENAVSGAAFRPGDIVRCYNGKTVETVNTDAEGRLILADAMSWAAEERPDAIVELSTLTGACVMALGHHSAGLFTPDEGLAGELRDAAQRSGEKLWRLPVGPEYLEEMKGTHADLRNSATRWGAASTAAAFLSQFVGDVSRWAHLDIAGVAYVGRDQNGHPGATGFGIATLIAWLRALTAS